jgi:putative redox protein
MVEIKAELVGGTRVALSNGRHDWLADETLEKGGEDSGPNPYEMLLGSLAACTLVTLVLYTRHKGIELEGVSARYTHEKITAPEGQSGLVDRLTSHVTIQGEYDEPIRKRLEQIVGRCPVHKTIENGTHVVDEVVFAGGRTS